MQIFLSLQLAHLDVTADHLLEADIQRRESGRRDEPHLILGPLGVLLHKSYQRSNVLIRDTKVITTRAKDVLCPHLE